MKIQAAEFTALLNDAEKYGSVEKSLWAELEEDDMLDMEDDRSWYQKFGPKLNQSEPGLLEKLRERVSRIKIHFQKVVDKDLEVPSSQATKSQTENGQATSLSRIVRRIMGLVSDHGVALEFLRELFNAQDIKLAKVEDKINAPGTMGPD